MNYPILISAASSTVALFALVITWMNYRINRKMPNENKLFEEKIKSYRSVLTAFNTAAAVYIECGNEYSLSKGSAQTKNKLKDELDDEIDKAYNLMEDTVNEQMLVLPDEVFVLIDAYFDLFDQEDFLEETAGKGNIKRFTHDLDLSFDAVIDAMRKDLSFDKLNTGLRKRINGRQRVKYDKDDTQE